MDRTTAYDAWVPGLTADPFAPAYETDSLPEIQPGYNASSLACVCKS